MIEIAQLKKVARLKLKRTLAKMSRTDIIAESRMVCERVRHWPVYERARNLALFVSMPSGELDTSMLLQSAFEDNKRVFVPRVHQDRLMLIEAFSMADIASFEVSSYGIPEPPLNDSKRAQPLHDDKLGIDVVLVPGLAFDRQGLRLGRGKGYYDRFLQELDAASSDSRPVRCGVALSPQLVESVPVLEHDLPVDILFTPLEQVLFSSH